MISLFPLQKNSNPISSLLKWERKGTHLSLSWPSACCATCTRSLPLVLFPWSCDYLRHMSQAVINWWVEFKSCQCPFTERQGSFSGMSWPQWMRGLAGSSHTSCGSMPSKAVRCQAKLVKPMVVTLCCCVFLPVLTDKEQRVFLESS
jgi:hypothetical protein